MDKSRRATIPHFVALLIPFLCGLASARAQPWPDIFDPTLFQTLNLAMDPFDWDTLQADTTFSDEFLASFWADAESPISVAVRRKSSVALTADPGFDKVSLKIDINQFVVGQKWHDLTKLSLETGDDTDLVSEGLAWHLHHLATSPQGYRYNAGYANWVRLIINDVDTGVYVSTEQRDKQFLRNRGLWTVDQAWLYKFIGAGALELAVPFGGLVNSPTFNTLCYTPFDPSPTCATPDDPTLVADLPTLIDIQSMLTMEAVNAFAANPDSLFTTAQNGYFADYLFTTRMYLPWDLDTVFGPTTAGIYAGGSAYDIFLTIPQFRAQYNQIFNDLLCGPFTDANIIAFLDLIEPVLTSALALDPNSQIVGTVPDHFDALRAWVAARTLNVKSQLDAFTTCGTDNCPSDPSKTEPGICGCGTPDTDTDTDGTADCLDGCPTDRAKTDPGQCGCGVLELDFDGDSISECVDICFGDDNLLGLPCDGAVDTDLCDTGLWDCITGLVTCTDDSAEDVPAEPGTELTCNDTLDNDCDGLTDAADPDCAPPSCTNECGDINGDSAVDLFDFASFAGCFGFTQGVPPQCLCSDLDNDGLRVNLLDFSTFALLFGGNSTNTIPNCP